MIWVMMNWPRAGDLAELPRNRLYRHRGIALAVARELHQIADRLRRQFSGEDAKDKLSADSTMAKLSVDAAAALLIPKKGDETQRQILGVCRTNEVRLCV